MGKVFPPGCKFRLERNDKKLPGKFSAKAAKTKAIDLSIKTGDEIEVHVIGGHGAIASARSGQWCRCDAHDEEGHRLGFELYPGDEMGDG